MAEQSIEQITHNIATMAAKMMVLMRYIDFVENTAVRGKGIVPGLEDSMILSKFAFDKLLEYRDDLRTFAETQVMTQSAAQQD